MAQEIRLNTEELLAQAGELEGIQGDFDTLLKNVESELNMINSSWSANLARNFSGKIAISRSWFGRLTSLLGNGAAAARYCAQYFVDTDTGLAHATSGNSSDGPVSGGGGACGNPSSGSAGSGSGGGGGGSRGGPSSGEGLGGDFSGPGGSSGGGGGGSAILDDTTDSGGSYISDSLDPSQNSAGGNLTLPDIIQKAHDGTLKQEDVSTFAERASGGSKTVQAVIENGLSYGFATNKQAQELNTGIQQCEDLCNHYANQGDTWQSLKYAGFGAALETAKAVTGGLNAAYDVFKNTMGVPDAIGMGEICSGLSTLGKCIFNIK